MITTYGGRTNVPVVFEDLVLISAVVVGWGDTPEYDGLARPAHRFMAFDKATGELRWLAGTTHLAARHDLQHAGGDGRSAARRSSSSAAPTAACGACSRAPASRCGTSRCRTHGINVSPLVVGDTVYTATARRTSSARRKGAVVALDATLRGDLTGKEKWIDLHAHGRQELAADGRRQAVGGRPTAPSCRSSIPRPAS